MRLVWKNFSKHSVCMIQKTLMKHAPWRNGKICCVSVYSSAMTVSRFTTKSGLFRRYHRKKRLGDLKRSLTAMQFEEQKACALDAVRSRIDQFRSALTVTSEQVRGLLSGSISTDEDRSEALGFF